MLNWKPYFALLVLTLMVVPQYAKAVATEEITVNLDYTPVGNNDQVVNRLDDAATTNKDTWDPEPSGVWIGGWTPESKFRLSEVPDTDFTLGLASVVSFSPNMIMSGVSQMTVRLPIYTGNWTYGALHIYHIQAGANWSFEANDPTTFGSDLPGPMTLNFSAGFHQLVAWTEELGPGDLSPTDGNDHFTRSNRTYVSVQAPILPDQFYLFVAYFSYPSDEYVEFFWQPDTLSEGAWNRSTVGWYNLYDPDLYGLSSEDYGASLGWSFDMVQGFGNNGACWDKFFYEDDEVTGLFRMNKTRILPSDYLTFMFPFWAEIPNVSLTVTVDLVLPDLSHTWSGLSLGPAEWNDFFLMSSTSNFTTLLGVDWVNWTGWGRFNVAVHNDTRLRFFLKEDPREARYVDSDWTWMMDSHLKHVWDSSLNWDASQFFLFDEDLGGGAHRYAIPHFQLQYAAQSTSYQWSKSMGPPIAPTETEAIYSMSWTQDYFWLSTFMYILGVCYIFAPGLSGLMSYAITSALYAKFHDVVNKFFGSIHDGLDNIWDKLRDFGQWLWKVGQRIMGALTWLAEQIVYYGSIILAIFILILSVFVFFFIIWLPMKLGMVLRSALFGDLQGAQAQIGELASIAGGIKSRASGFVGKIRRSF